jgi:hypothetical protein
MNDNYRTLRVDVDGHGVVTAAIDAPPMNLVGPELVRDLVALLASSRPIPARASWCWKAQTRSTSYRTST